MNWIPWILLVASIITILFLLLRPRKKEKIYIERDLDRELKERVDKEYQSKAAEIAQELAIQREKALLQVIEEQKERQRKIKEEDDSFALSLAAKRTELVSNLDNELTLRKEYNKKAALELEEQLKIAEEEANCRIEGIKQTILDWQSRQSAAIESFKKLDELNNAETYHRIVFDRQEIDELNELNHAILKLRNPMPFRKAVYDIYYKNKISDLVNRIVGKEKVGGIYKITHIESGKTYVGQSVDIGNRWKQHAKRGCGADALTNNKLYPAMLEFGVESFMFEIVEKVEDSARLNELEKYWQEYFQAKDFGFSVR